MSENQNIFLIEDDEFREIIGYCTNEDLAQRIVDNSKHGNDYEITEVPCLDKEAEILPRHHFFRTSVFYELNDKTNTWDFLFVGSYDVSSKLKRDKIRLVTTRSSFQLIFFVSSSSNDEEYIKTLADSQLNIFLDKYPLFRYGICHPKCVAEYDKYLKELYRQEKGKTKKETEE